MQVQCPHCKSRYRLDSDMIDAYGGFVRCGNCNYKFNIHDQVLIEDEQNDLVNTAARPARERQVADSDASGASAARGERVEPRLERDEEEDAYNIRFRPDGSEEDDEELISLEDLYEPRLAPDVDTDSGSSDGSESVPLEDFQFPDSMESLDITQDDEFGPAFDELAEQVLDDETPDGEGPEYAGRSEPVLFDSLQEPSENDDSDGLTLLNDEMLEEPDRTGVFRRLGSLLWRGVQFLFWLVLAVYLAYLLIGQLKDTLYPAYKNYALIQQLRATSCAFLPCDEAGYDVELYEIVVSRMDEVQDDNRQLHVSIFLLNKSKQAQYYPNILLTLKTIDGTTVGQRVIEPEEYLTSHDSLISSSEPDLGAVNPLVKPNKLGKILIKLDKPPAEAVGFEARVVE